MHGDGPRAGVGTFAVLGAILVTGALLRVAYLVELRASPAFAAPAVDAQFHDWWARGIALGDWIPPEGLPDPGVRTSAWFRPPGYPYFLAAVYAVSGGSYTAARVAAMLLGLASALVGFAVARRAFGPGAGLLAAGLLATHWVLVYFEGELLEPAPLVFLLLGFTALLGRWRERGSTALLAAAGAVGGLACLVRPNALLVVAAAVAWTAWIAARGGPGRLRRAAASAAVLVAGAAVAIAPATIRNVVVSGEPVLISSNAGINLYIGNHELADGLVAAELPGLGAFRTCFDEPRIAAALERQEGRPLGAADVSAVFTRRALGWIRDHPGRFAALTVRKALLFWGPREVGHNSEVAWERHFSRVLRAIPTSFPLLVALAAFGTVASVAAPRSPVDRSQARRDLLALAWLVVGAWFASVLPFFAAARYRVPVVPFLILIGAAGVGPLAAALRERRWRRAAASAGAFAAVAGLASIPFADYEPSRARWHFDRGTDWNRIDEPERAIEQYREAVRLDPDYFEAHDDLGHGLRGRGDRDGARRHWEEALRAAPLFVPGWIALGELEREAGRTVEAAARFERALALAPDSLRATMALGDLRAAAGDVARAREMYERAVALDAGHVPALRNLALLLASDPDSGRRDPGRAIALAERADTLAGGRSPSAADALAYAYAAGERWADAARAARRAADLAASDGHDELARRIRARLAGYESRR